jgi:transcriptional regulator with XRE-family HTH domain
MSRRKRLEDEQQAVLAMRAAALDDHDSAPARIPDTFDARLTYESASLSDQVLNEVNALIARRRMSQQDLARRLSVTEGRVSQILSGNQNLTIKTLASLAAALEGHFQITLVSTVGVDPWEPKDGSEPGGAVVPHQRVTQESQSASPLVPAGRHRH